MGITVTTNTAGSPPNFQISVAPSNGATVTSITVNRTAYGVTEPIRTQPTVGPSPRIAYDYEAFWNTDVVYTATVATSSSSETFTSTAAQLAPTVAWMIHPSTPALSCILDSRTNSSAGIVSLSPLTRPATTTVHDIIGSKYRLVTRSGPRAASRFQMIYATVTPTEEARFWAMVTDQSPIVFRTPADFGWGFEDGYYDLGDISIERFSPYGPEPRRNFTVPLERVDTPAGTQQAARTWADVTAGFANWSNVTAAYATWGDVLTDSRR